MALDAAKLSFATPFSCQKEYDRKAATLAITGTVATGNILTISATVTLLRDDSVTTSQFTTTVNSTYHVNNQTYTFLPDCRINHTNGSTPSLPGTAPYDVFFQNQFNGNTVTLNAVVFNPNAETLTVVNETLSFTLYSLIYPWG